jgi:hypothetical protein
MTASAPATLKATPIRGATFAAQAMIGRCTRYTEKELRPMARVTSPSVPDMGVAETRPATIPAEITATHPQPIPENAPTLKQAMKAATKSQKTIRAGDRSGTSSNQFGFVA